MVMDWLDLSVRTFLHVQIGELLQTFAKCYTFFTTFPIVRVEGHVTSSAMVVGTIFFVDVSQPQTFPDLTRATVSTSQTKNR